LLRRGNTNKCMDLLFVSKLIWPTVVLCSQNFMASVLRSSQHKTPGRFSKFVAYSFFSFCHVLWKNVGIDWGGLLQLVQLLCGHWNIAWWPWIGLLHYFKVGDADAPKTWK
jgi:hypothetical protein